MAAHSSAAFLATVAFSFPLLLMVPATLMAIFSRVGLRRSKPSCVRHVAASLAPPPALNVVPMSLQLSASPARPSAPPRPQMSAAPAQAIVSSGPRVPTATVRPVAPPRSQVSATPVQAIASAGPRVPAAPLRPQLSAAPAPPSAIRDAGAAGADLAEIKKAFAALDFDRLSELFAKNNVPAETLAELIKASPHFARPEPVYYSRSQNSDRAMISGR